MLDQILREMEHNSYALIPNLISAGELKAINRFFDEHRDEFTPALVGSKENRQRMDEIRGDYTFWIDALSPVAPFD
jgi:hypothetical protein